jgi:protein SCO1/2
MIRTVLKAGLGAAILLVLAACGGESSQGAAADVAGLSPADAERVSGENDSVSADGEQVAVNSDSAIVGEGRDGHGVHYETPPLESLGGKFELINAADGSAYTDSQLLGSWSLIYLGYMECLEACPIALKSMPVAAKEINEAGVPIKSVFIDINAPRLDDMSGAMGHGAGESHAQAAAADVSSGAHAGEHGAGVTGPEVRRLAIKDWSKIYDPSIVMLAGSRKQLNQAKRIFQTRVEQSMMPTQESIHHLNHTTAIYVMNPEGKIVGILYHSDPSGLMARTVKELARPGSSKT